MPKFLARARMNLRNSPCSPEIKSECPYFLFRKITLLPSIAGQALLSLYRANFTRYSFGDYYASYLGEFLD
jgi:hypothetical protein